MDRGALSSVEWLREVELVAYVMVELGRDHYFYEYAEGGHHVTSAKIEQMLTELEPVLVASERKKVEDGIPLYHWSVARYIVICVRHSGWHAAMSIPLSMVGEIDGR